MEPIKKQRTTSTEYWSCGKDYKGHYHSEKRFAERCIARQSAPFVNFADVCKQKANRNKKIIKQYIKLKTVAKTAKSLGLSYGCVANVLDQAKHICWASPMSDYPPITRLKGGRYTTQSWRKAYQTLSLSVDDMRSLVDIWVSSKNKHWGWLCELSEKLNDGPPLYRLSDDEIRNMLSASQGLSQT